MQLDVLDEEDIVVRDAMIRVQHWMRQEGNSRWQRLDILPQHRWDMRSRIPQHDDYKLRVSGYHNSYETFEQKAFLRPIPVRQIVSCQTHVSAYTVSQKIKEIGPHSPAFPHAYFCEQTGLYHLTDGNHRVNAAIFKGDLEIDGMVIVTDPVHGAF